MELISYHTYTDDTMSLNWMLPSYNLASVSLDLITMEAQNDWFTAHC